MPGATLPIAPDLYRGRTLGKYELLCRLSTGGMSEIFLAAQRGLAGFRKLVVIKSILPDIRGEEEFVRMFLDEAKITAAFNHPNIAQVYDLDIDDGELFLAMEFVPGCTLVEVARACRQNNEPIPTGFSIMAVRDTALALHYAHTFVDPLGRKQTVIHRDVAEKNIMVTYEGVTKLLDFGIAKSLNRTGRTSIGMVKGTSGYMSPEQIRGEPLDPRSDVFSLGVVLHECLTGMRLFHGKNPEDGMIAALKDEVQPPSRQNPEVPPELDAVVLKALERDRDNRFSTALELARAIEKAAQGLIWHPEQSGELVQRLFAERREQTYKLFEQAQQASGELTGDIQLGALLGHSGDTSRPTKAIPRVPQGAMAAAPPPVETVPPPAPAGERKPTAVVSPAVTPFPARTTTRPQKLSPAGGDEKSITETTPVAHGRERTEPNVDVARLEDTRNGRPRLDQPPPTADYDDENDGRTIPAAVLPDGVFAPPGKDDYVDEPDDYSPEAKTIVRTDGLGTSDDTTSNRADVLAEGLDTTNTITLSRRRGAVFASVLIGISLAVAVFAVGVFALGLHEDFFAAPEDPSAPRPLAIEPLAEAPPAARTEAAEKEKQQPPAPAEPLEAEVARREPPPEPKPEVKPEPKTETNLEAKVEPKQETKPEPARKAEAEPKPEAKRPEPKPEVAKAEVKPEAAVNVASRPATDDASKARAPKKRKLTPPPEKREVAPPEKRESPAPEERKDERKAAGPGLLRLVTEPYATKVMFKSQDLGPTPLIDASLPAGRHTLKLHGSDGNVYLLPIEVKEGVTLKIRMKLSELPTE